MTGSTPVKKVYLHIGLPKTGTSYLQRFFHRNSARLQKVGVLYPTSGRRLFAHHSVAALFRDRPLNWVEPVDTVVLSGAITDEIDCSENQSVLLSSEALAGVSDISKLHKLFDAYDVRILAVVRRQDSMFASMYSQNLKMGKTTLSPREYFEERRASFDFNKRIRKWEDEFGYANVSLFCYEDMQAAKGIEIPILTELGVSDAWYKAPAVTNQTPDATSLAFLARMGRKHGELRGNDWNRVRQLLIQRAAESGYKRRKYLLEPGLRQHILKSFEVSNRRLFQRFDQFDPDRYSSSADDVITEADIWITHDLDSALADAEYDDIVRYIASHEPDFEL